MKKYAGFRNGYVRVRIYGEQTERFLNLCRAHEIRISDLRKESDLSLTGCLQIRDFFRLAPIHRKTKVKIHILEKHGLPFFFYRSKKRKAFLLGQGPVSRMEFFVFRKMECWKQINHLLCEWLEML